MTRRIATIPASLLIFLAGVSAAAAVNLITGLIDAAGTRRLAAGVSAIPWAVAAACLMYAGAVLEDVRREADIARDPEMTRVERSEIYLDALMVHGGAVRVCIALTIAVGSAAAGVMCGVILT